MEEKPGGLSDLKELPDSGFFVLSPGDFSPRAPSEMPPRRSVGSPRPASAPGGSASQQEAARAQQQRVEQLQQQPPATPPDEAERRRAKNAKKRAKAKRTKKAAEKQKAEEAAAAGPTEEQIKIVRELALNMRALSCGIVGSAFARLPAYLPAERAGEIREGIAKAQRHDTSSPDQIARIMEPLMGKAMAALTGDAELRQTFDGLLDEGIKERIPDDSTRCYVLLGVRVREAELVMQHAFPAKHKETLQTAHAEAEAARAAGTEEGEALADEILRAADAKVTKDGGGACKRPKPAFSGGWSLVGLTRVVRGLVRCPGAGEAGDDDGDGRCQGCPLHIRTRFCTYSYVRTLICAARCAVGAALCADATLPLRTADGAHVQRPGAVRSHSPPALSRPQSAHEELCVVQKGDGGQGQ